jgi:hypothetical protein
MTTYNFRLLPYNEQVAILYQDGVFIGKRSVGNDTLLLYQLDSFYVEIRYKKYRYFIHSVKIFRGIEALDPYLHHINVLELMRC